MSKICFRFLVTSIAGMALFCSCATVPTDSPPAAAADLPAEVAMSKLSRFAPELMVTVHLENGAEFECCLDTGSPGIALPKLVEPQLGKRIGRLTIETLDGIVDKARVYAAPKIYLGDTPLATGERVAVWNRPYGIIGMSCLRHYCMQLDFQKRKIRFLKPGNTNVAELGRAFPLTGLEYTCIRQSGFFEQNDSTLLIDMGYPIDGMMNSKSLKQAMLEHDGKPVPTFGEGKPSNFPLLASFPTCSWGGETYTNLIVQGGNQRIIGLKFLARHLVTFDFPNKVMYLKYIGETDAPALH